MEKCNCLNQSTASAILATLSDSGPASMRELCDTLHATRGAVDHERVCQELYGLIRADKVAVSCGIYQLKGE